MGSIAFDAGARPGAAPSVEMPHELAAFASEMISWTWFAETPLQHGYTLSPVSLSSPSVSPFDHPALFAQQHRLSTATAPSLPPSLSPLSMPTAYSPALQPNQQPPPAHSLKHILPSPQFVRFVNYVLQTTQVGQAAVLLSILYLERYRRFVVSSAKAAGGRHRGGNEFRLFVTSLMLANKTLDDNTYTNSTWSSISGLPLVEINSMERQFLAGLSFHLHVTPDEYRAWLGRLFELNNQRKDALRSLTAFRSSASSSQRPMSGGSHSSRPSFACGTGQPFYSGLQQHALPLFGAPPPQLEGFNLHPSYLPPPHQTHFNQPPVAHAQAHLPPILPFHPSLGGAVQAASGQLTPRASFDGSASLGGGTTLNVNPAISTPASHRTLDVVPSVSSSRKKTGKRRAGEAFSPTTSPLATADGDRPAKRLQTSLQPQQQQANSRPLSSGVIPPPPMSARPSFDISKACLWPGPPPPPNDANNASSSFQLPSLGSTSPLETLGQPFVFEANDALGAKQLFVCQLSVDGTRRYQVVQQQAPPLASMANPALAAPNYQPYVLPVQTLPPFRYGSQGEGLSGQQVGGGGGGCFQHLSTIQLQAPFRPLLLPPTSTTPLGQPSHPHHPQFQHPQHQPLFAYPPPAPLPAQVPPSVVSQREGGNAPEKEEDPDAAKRKRVERWRREVSASSGGDY